MGERAVLLRWEAVSKSFGTRTLFRNVAGEVADGSVVAILGPNGSGKSTLLRILAGLIRPSAGRVAWDETRLGGRRKLGYAAPYLNLYHELTATENLEFFAKLTGERPERKQISARLEAVGLAKRDHEKQLGSYSSGMLQRARLAFAMLSRPAVLFLDEPGSNLDEAGRAVVRTIVAEQRGSGAVLVATNDPEEAALADRRIDLG